MWTTSFLRGFSDQPLAMMSFSMKQPCVYFFIPQLLGWSIKSTVILDDLKILTMDPCKKTLWKTSLSIIYIPKNRAWQVHSVHRAFNLELERSKFKSSLRDPGQVTYAICLSSPNFINLIKTGIITVIYLPELWWGSNEISIKWVEQCLANRRSLKKILVSTLYFELPPIY